MTPNYNMETNPDLEDEESFYSVEEQMLYDMEVAYACHKNKTEPKPFSVEKFEEDKKEDLAVLSSSEDQSIEAFYYGDTRGFLVRWYVKTPEGCAVFIDDKSSTLEQLSKRSGEIKPVIRKLDEVIYLISRCTNKEQINEVLDTLDIFYKSQHCKMNVDDWAKLSNCIGIKQASLSNPQKKIENKSLRRILCGFR